MATSSWSLFGSAVVSLWSCRPGQLRMRTISPFDLPAHLRSSKLMAAITGIRRILERILIARFGQPRKLKSSRLTISTNTRKLVPHLGCRV